MQKEIPTDQVEKRPEGPSGNKENHFPTLVEEPSGKNAETKRQQTARDFNRVIKNNDIAIIVFFSALSVFAGIALFLIGVESNSSSSSPNFLTGLLGRAGGSFVFALTGMLLLIGPVFLNMFMLNAIREERDLRLKAQKRTREAQLLQDILTHDIRNYNQVSQLSADMIKEEFKDNQTARELVDHLLESIEGSTLLVERAKMLGRVISDPQMELKPVNLVESILRSFVLVRDSQPDKEIQCVFNIKSTPAVPVSSVNPERPKVEVLADNLLDNIFVNLFANSAKYTDGKSVFISIDIHEEKLQESKRVRMWRVSFADLGKGIPAEVKPNLFSRYLSGSKSSGLGLSIVHALVVERYGGNIQVVDRDEGANPKGTVVDIWLRKS